MGWLFMHSLDGHSGPRPYLDAQFTFERDGGRDHTAVADGEP